jgi:hypothetical protein
MEPILFMGAKLKETTAGRQQQKTGAKTRR